METPRASQVTYTPRPGSKTEAAVLAMHDGPVPLVQLAAVMDVPTSSVSAQLGPAIRNAMVVRVVDRAGASHFALRSMALPEGFSVANPESAPPAGAAAPAPDRAASRPAPDPADPFGQLAKAASVTKGPAVAPAQRAPYSRMPAAQAREQGAAAALAPVPSAPKEAAGDFVAALFSSGELMIQVGADAIRLSPDHQQKLQRFVAQIGLQA